MSTPPLSNVNDRQVGGSHYKDCVGPCPHCGKEIQHWDLFGLLPYLVGCATKYILRHRAKGKGREDLEKAKHYIDKILEQEYGVKPFPTVRQLQDAAIERGLILRLVPGVTCRCGRTMLSTNPGVTLAVCVACEKPSSICECSVMFTDRELHRDMATVFAHFSAGAGGPTEPLGTAQATTPEEGTVQTPVPLAGAAPIRVGMVAIPDLDAYAAEAARISAEAYANAKPTGPTRWQERHPGESVEMAPSFIDARESERAARVQRRVERVAQQEEQS